MAHSTNARGTDTKLKESSSSAEKRPALPRIPQVALLLETSTEYGRGLLRGILRYAKLYGPWSLSFAPGHLDQVLPAAGAWSGAGIIARIHSSKMEKRLRSMRLPMVASLLTEAPPASPTSRYGEIRTDSIAIARMGATHLIESGVRHFAYCGFTNFHWSVVREKAFQESLREAGFACATHRIPSTNWTKRPNWIERWQHEQPALAHWLKSLPKPVGIMACNDICAAEVLQVCTMTGIRVPDEVAVVGVDNDELVCELSDPPLSSIALDVEKAGFEAAHLLDGLMSGQLKTGQVVLVQPTYVAIRRSSDIIAQEDPLVARALRFVRDQSRHALSVIDVAEEVGVSRRTLERRFLQALGHTVLDEIMHSHLLRAKQLLLETDFPCHQIATQAGFGSLKTFHRCFSRMERTTPQNFRQRSTAALFPSGETSASMLKTSSNSNGNPQTLRSPSALPRIPA
ncbi:MAG TPA: DNA-binding transcriptional regulator [Terriglobia bacterium]|nr:DNA-binding transcriptional regulator [Terriglobia bacterium]